MIDPLKGIASPKVRKHRRQTDVEGTHAAVGEKQEPELVAIDSTLDQIPR
jgi:hypothetical protein